MMNNFWITFNDVIFDILMHISFYLRQNKITKIKLRVSIYIETKGHTHFQIFNY